MKLLRRSLARALIPPRGLVLLYHRVAAPKSDPQLLAVSPKNFADHLRVLRDRYPVIGASDLLEGRSARPGVAITFDDGYSDNLTEAAPLLVQMSCPATIFAVAPQTSASGEFWWDRLQRVILDSPRLPDVLEVDIDATHFSVHSDFETPVDPAWSVMDEPLSARQKVYVELHRLLRVTTTPVRERALDQLATWADVDRSGPRENQPVSEQQLRELADVPGVTIGSHSMTHANLAAIEEADAKREIVESKGALEAILGRPIEHFSYPFGGPSDFTSGTMSLVRDAGYRTAFANWAGVVRRTTNRFSIPRVIVRDWSPEVFARVVESYVGS